MKIEDIDKLLIKFYKGDTDGKEEEFLVNYFTHDNLPVSRDKDRNVFLALSSFETEVPSGLEQKMASLIDSLEQEEKKTAKNRVKIEFRKRVIGIAASVILVVGIGFWYQYQNNSNRSTLTETFENPQESQEAVIAALRLFSLNFSKGTETIEKADSQIDKTLRIVNQVFNDEPVHKQTYMITPDK